jgi:hypothetical protein
MSDTIVNKVAQSGLITLNLEDYFPKDEIKKFDLKDFLFMGLILKEKDFRGALKNLDWDSYKGQYVAITCTADAIIHKYLFLQKIHEIDTSAYAGQRVVVKGCGELPVGDFAYAALTKRLLPVVKSLMYGEPCSTVPVYKSPASPGPSQGGVI